MYVASSFSSLLNYERENISKEGILKRFALLYDNIIFNRFGCPIGNGSSDLAKNVAEWVSLMINGGGSFQERKVLGKNKEFAKIFIDCWDVVENPKKFESNKFSVIENSMGTQIGEFCHQEIRRINGLPDDSYAYDIDDVKELCGDIYSDIGLNTLLQKEGVELIPSFSPLIGRALEDTSKLEGISVHSLFEKDLLVPSFDDFSWDEIIDLRTDKYVKAFRKVVFDISSKSKELDKALLERVLSDLWRMVADTKPDIGATLLSGFLGNLPSPTIINPIGIGSFIKDFNDKKRLDNDYGHVYFIHKLRTPKTNGKQ